MKLNDYLRIIRDSEIETDGFEIKEIISNDNKTKILRLGSLLKLDTWKDVRNISVRDYFYWDLYEEFENIELHFVLFKYIIRDVLRS